MMSRSRKIVVYTLLAILLVGHLFDALTNREHWPFSNYPMYANVAQQTMAFYELDGVIDGPNGSSKEVAIDWHWMPGLPLYKLVDRLSRLSDDPKVLKQVMDDYLATYNTMRRVGLNNGPPLQAIRLYRVELPLLLPLIPLDEPHTTSALVKRALVEADQRQIHSRNAGRANWAPEDRS